MSRNIKLIYIYEFLIFFFIIFFKIFILDSFIMSYNIVNIVFWSILSFLMILTLGIMKDKNYYKSFSVRVVIINILSYALIIYVLGFLTGFYKFPYSHDINTVISNILPIIVLIFFQEIIRFIVAKNSVYTLKPIVLLTILFICMNIIINFSTTNFNTFQDVFEFFFVVCVPIISKQLLYSYCSYKISITPVIILRICFEIYYFILPFFPDLGDYLRTIFDLILAFSIYKMLDKAISYGDKVDIYINKIRRRILLLPLIIFTIGIVTLVSGIFSYKLIAIASNSMYPVYERGDAIIYEKIDNDKLNSIKEGDILVFVRNSVIVTHRVVKITNNKDKIIFNTKGDNNEVEDNFEVNSDSVLGVVKYKIKYVGMFTIWLSEYFN